MVKLMVKDGVNVGVDAVKAALNRHQYFCEDIISEVKCSCNGSGIDGGRSWRHWSCIGIEGGVGTMVGVDGGRFDDGGGGPGGGPEGSLEPIF